MIGRTLAHYEIIEFVGAGGMGEVYRARDIRLGRNFEMMASSSSQEYVGRIVPSDNIVFMRA